MSATRTFDPDADRTRAHEQADATAGHPGLPPPPAQASSPPGYEIVGELGRGGMGVVYDAVQTTINRPCALKMVLGSGHAGSVALVRFLAEAEAVAAIDHPHVVRVFEFGNHGGQPFLAMERLDGGSLADRLKATGPLPVAEAVTLLEKIAAGVQAGHDLGIVHRDLKPANILLASDGTPKVTDFGLAKRDSGSDLTSTQAMMGTPDYMSPEQAQGRTKFVGPTADVYALGAVLFAALAGRPPFQADNLLDLRLKVIGEDPPALTKLVPGLPRDLAVIAAKCLAKAPADRYPTAAAFAEDLRRWRTGETIVARAASNQERAWKSMKRNRGLVTAAGVVVLALCVGMAATSVAAVRALAEAKRADGETVKARDEAERADGETAKARAETDRAEKQLDRAERLVYASQINSADRMFRTGATDAAVGSLNRTRWDMRGWEHDYLTTQFFAMGLTLTGLTGSVTSVAYSPDGTCLALACGNGTVKLWDIATGRERQSLSGHTGSVTSIGFSYDSTRMVSAGIDGNAKSWDISTGRVCQTLSGHTGSFASAAFSPDGNLVATAGGDGNVRLWDIATGYELLTLTGHTKSVVSVAFSPDGSRVVSASLDGTVKLWVTTTGREQRTLSGHAGSATSATFSPDGSRVVSTGGDHTVKLWDAATGREQQTLAEHTGRVSHATFSHDGTRIASASLDGTVMLWDAATGRKQHTINGHTGSVASVAFSPDDGCLASGGIDGTAKLWDATIGRAQPTLTRYKQIVIGVTFSPDRTHEAWASRNGQVELLNTSTGKLVRKLNGHTEKVNDISFSTSGSLLATSSADKTIKIWNTSTGHEVCTLSGHSDSVNCAAFNQDASLLVSAADDKTVRVWDAVTGRIIHTFVGHTGEVKSASFSPDSKRVASASLDKTVKIWDTNLGSELKSLECRNGTIAWMTVKFTTDGRGIVHDGDEQVRTTWNTPIQRYENAIANTSGDVVHSLAMGTGVNRLVARSDKILDTVWSLTTGQLLEDEPIPAGLTFVTRADLPDGKRVAFIDGGKIVVRDKAKYAAFQAEMARRLAEYAKPKPDWHAKSFDEAVAAKDGFAARFHLGYLRKIKGDADPAVTSREPLLPTEGVPKPGG